jgi:hypothetical protein
MTEFAEWDSFYLIVGSAGAALIGLQFVVMTLIAGRPDRPDYVVGATFATPTIVHFGAVLLIAAVIRAPWTAVGPVAALLGLIGFGGIIYTLFVIRLMRTQSLYDPVFEDWLFHALFPIAAYTILAVSTLVAFSHLREALFGVGSSSLLLLFTGIHNAWDTVTYNVFANPPNAEGSHPAADKSEVTASDTSDKLS